MYYQSWGSTYTRAFKNIVVFGLKNGARLTHESTYTRENTVIREGVHRARVPLSLVIFEKFLRRTVKNVYLVHRGLFPPLSPPPSPHHNRHLLPLPLLQNCRIWLPLSKILYPPLESFAHWSQQSTCRDRGVGGQGGTCPLNIFKIIELQCSKKKSLVPPPNIESLVVPPPPNLQVAPRSLIWPSGQPSCQLGFSTLIINYLTVCKTLR